MTDAVPCALCGWPFHLHAALVSHERCQTQCRSEKPKLSPETARSILELEFSEEDKARMHELAAKVRAGTLSAEECEEVETYSRVGSILGIMKSKARMILKKAEKKAAGTRR